LTRIFPVTKQAGNKEKLEKKEKEGKEITIHLVQFSQKKKKNDKEHDDDNKGKWGT
jgi:hypothetical protein